MTYDQILAARIRDRLHLEFGIDERAMFGGLAFTVHGNMAVAATSQGLLLRIDPAQADTLLEDPAATRFVMQGRELNGWLRVDLDREAPDVELHRWVDVGIDYAGTLPPKR